MACCTFWIVGRGCIILMIIMPICGGNFLLIGIWIFYSWKLSWIVLDWAIVRLYSNPIKKGFVKCYWVVDWNKSSTRYNCKYDLFLFIYQRISFIKQIVSLNLTFFSHLHHYLFTSQLSKTLLAPVCLHFLTEHPRYLLHIYVYISHLVQNECLHKCNLYV